MGTTAQKAPIVQKMTIFLILIKVGEMAIWQKLY